MLVAVGMSWTAAAGWSLQGETATEAPGETANVVFTPFVGATRTVVVDGAVAPASVKVDGDYAFLGTGTLELDQATVNLATRNEFGSMFNKFEGSLVLKNGTSVTLSGNNNVKNALGLGKLVLGGCTIAGGLTGSFDNSEIEVVAGTVNTSTAAFPLPLDKVVVTGDVKDLRKAERTVLTTVKGSMTEGATLSDSMKANGWRVRTVANKDGETITNYTVELFKSGIAIIIK